jgi:hypothetical protein
MPPDEPLPAYPPAGHPYGAPQQGPVQYVAVPARKTNGLAIASLVLGIVWIFWLGSILALVFGYVAKGQIDRSGGLEGGRGLAVAGIVLGWVGLGLLGVLILLGIGVTSGSSP